MGRSPRYNDEIYRRLKSKSNEEYMSKDARAALNLARSTGKLEHKIMSVSICNYARQNELEAWERAHGIDNTVDYPNDEN